MTKFSVAGAGLNATVAGAATSFQIQSRDVYGNLAAADQTLLAARLASSAASVVPIVTVVGGSLGLYSAAMTPTTAGQYNLSVTYNGTLFGGATSPLLKTVLPSKTPAYSKNTSLWFEAGRPEACHHLQSKAFSGTWCGSSSFVKMGLTY